MKDRELRNASFCGLLVIAFLLLDTTDEVTVLEAIARIFAALACVAVALKHCRPDWLTK